jgi:hypothetical protein
MTLPQFIRQAMKEIYESAGPNWESITFDVAVCGVDDAGDGQGPRLIVVKLSEGPQFLSRLSFTVKRQEEQCPS